jgi:diguanylate cyclase (GGDEF)-like protein
LHRRRPLQGPDNGQQPAEDSPIKTLLIESNPDHARLVREQLAAAAGNEATGGYDVELSPDIADGLDRLSAGHSYDLVLLGLPAPGGPSGGLDEVLERIGVGAPEATVLILADRADEAEALLAVQHGADDYVLTDDLSGDILPRVVRYATKSRRLQARLSSESIRDGLTGLYNRRGLLVLGPQQLAVSPRLDRDALLLYLDLDNTGWINATFGRDEGDKALAETARLLRESFRRADLLARVGGDEFAALALFKRGDDPDAAIRRFHSLLQERNDRDVRYPLSYSLGVVNLDTRLPVDLDQVLGQAEAQMRQQRGKGVDADGPESR